MLRCAGNAALTETFVYTANDNMTSRTRVGTYIYPAPTAARPHAPTKIGAADLTYDANGNLFTDGTRTFGWMPATGWKASSWR